MKDLGLVNTILRIKLKKNSGGYELSQMHYIEKMLNFRRWVLACLKACIITSTKELYGQIIVIFKSMQDALP